MYGLRGVSAVGVCRARGGVGVCIGWGVGGCKGVCRETLFTLEGRHELGPFIQVHDTSTYKVESSIVIVLMMYISSVGHYPNTALFSI